MLGQQTDIELDQMSLRVLLDAYVKTDEFVKLVGSNMSRVNTDSLLFVFYPLSLGHSWTSLQVAYYSFFGLVCFVSFCTTSFVLASAFKVINWNIAC